MKKILLMAILWSVVTVAYSQGVKFDKALNWKQIKAKAKKENKYIFIDCFATWCGPCKWMDHNIFTKKEVGDYLNSQFINFSLQMDQTSKDSPEIRNLYEDAKLIRTQYSITAFPTYLFFDVNGNVLHRLVGVSRDPSDFIKKVKDTFSPEKQYYTVIKKVESHKRDSAFLFNAIQQALREHDQNTAEVIGNYYFSCLKNPLTKENIITLKNVLYSVNDAAFPLFLNNMGKINEMMGQRHFAESWLGRFVINREEIDPLFVGNQTIYWDKVLKNIKTKYPKINKEIEMHLKKKFDLGIELEFNKVFFSGVNMKVEPDWKNAEEIFYKRFPGNDSLVDSLSAISQTKYYSATNSWDKYATSTLAFIDRYGKFLSPSGINDKLWPIFLHCAEDDILKKALVLSEKTVQMAPKDYQNIDTFSNLLYKIGRKVEALEWEKKAVELVERFKKDDPSIYNDILDAYSKMQRGEKTWIN